MWGDKFLGMSERLLAEQKATMAMGTARMLLQRLETEGFTIRVDDEGQVRISPKPEPDFLRELVQAKPELVKLMQLRQHPESPVQ